MVESELYTGIVTVLFDKYVEPILNGVVGVAKREWEKFKINFDIVYSQYLSNAVDKYGKIKTILYRTEPKYIYDFFECPNLHKEKGEIISGDSIDNILQVSNFVIVQGTGGIGKSTFLKHLFMDEISKRGWIPIFIELKDLNLINDDYEISDFVFQRLYDLGSSIKKEYLEYALQSGCFVFLLDGYDEIATSKKDIFLRKFESFCDRYPNNQYILSSRPYSEFIEFQRFTVLTMCQLDKKQALSLISKIEFDQEIKQHFMDALDKSLYKKHKSFASNPLLLNIMLLTFDNYAEIPEKLHLFYSNAFETLYSKHDATKSGYRRELKCTLSYDSFKQVFSYFCFITYYQNRIEFTHDDILSVLKKVQSTVSSSFELEPFVFDLVNSICVLYRDGLNYKFSHRSFQEYFAAIFLKELSDSSMQKMGLNLARKDYFRASHDTVFSMLRDMAEQRFEQNILLPILIEAETEYDSSKYENKYDYYHKQISPEIIFQDYDRGRKRNGHDKAVLMVSYEAGSVWEFLWIMSRYYRNNDVSIRHQEEQAEERLKTFLIEERDYKIGELSSSIDYALDCEIYSMVKETWIGTILQIMAHLRETLEQRKKTEELDLNCLIAE